MPEQNKFNDADASIEEAGLDLNEESMIPDEIEIRADQSESPADGVEAKKEDLGDEINYNTVLPRLESLEDEILSIKSQIGEELSYQIKIAQKATNEIAELKGDQVALLLVPVLSKLSNLVQQLDNAIHASSDEPSKVNELEYYQSVLLDSIELLGFDQIPCRPLDEFSSKNHRAKATIETDESSHDKKIAQVLKRGYSHTTSRKTTMPAEVVVFKYISA